MLVLKNCRLIPDLTEGYSGETADIVIENGVIKDILPIGSVSCDAETIDVQGKTVMPGLFDLHMHHNFDTMNIDEIAHRNESNGIVRALAYGRFYLQRGYTFIRDCGIMNYAGQYLKKLYNNGIAAGPRLMTSGACNTPITTGNSMFGPVYKEFTGPEEAWRVVREDVANGCDFIKYMVTGAVMNEGGDPGAMICTKEELQAVVDAANSVGTYVACHCHGKKGIMACLETGVGTIEHCTFIDEECIETFLKYNNRSAMIPTMGVQYAMKENISGDVPKFMQDKCAAFFDAMVENTRKAYDAGLRIGWGTDFERPIFENNPALEFHARTLLGLKPVQLLKMATIDSARIVHVDDKCGTVKVNKWADLIVIDGNPDEDINVMDKAPVHVLKGGKLYF